MDMMKDTTRGGDLKGGVRGTGIWEDMDLDPNATGMD